jgi:hypothetical protein
VPAAGYRGGMSKKPASTLPLPHERDQSAGQVSTKPQRKIVQAQRDIEAGQVDTDLRATPGLDAPRRARLVKKPARPR